MAQIAASTGEAGAAHAAVAAPTIRSGATFTLEKQLVDVLRDGSAAALEMGGGWHIVRPEVTVRTRIPDLVLLHASEKPVATPARVSYFEAAIFAYLLERGACDITDLAEQLYASAPAVETRATRLVRLGLLEFTGRKIRASRDAFPQEVRITAIEAKLVKWKEALEQAKSYKTFANESYIAMPISIFDRIPAILPACSTEGVGAIGVDPSGEISILSKPTAVALQTPEWLRLVSSFVGVSTQAVKASSQIA